MIAFGKLVLKIRFVEMSADLWTMENVANGCYVWESYVAGLDPTDEKSVFKALIAIKDGKPVVTYDPVLTAEQTSLRKYTVYGKRDVSDDSWTEVSAGNESSFGFFMVTVEKR